jgi:hypothetical protein
MSLEITQSSATPCYESCVDDGTKQEIQTADGRV